MKCDDLPRSYSKEEEQHLQMLDSWVNALRLECNSTVWDLSICNVSEDVEVPCYSILQLTTFYRFVEFRTTKDLDTHVVLFRVPHSAFLDNPFRREFQVTSSNLAQILQLHHLLNPVQLMVVFAKQHCFPFASTIESKSERMQAFRDYSKMYLGKGDKDEQDKLTDLALDAFDLWWSYQLLFNLHLAENIILAREKSQGVAQISTPTTMDRRGLTFNK